MKSIFLSDTEYEKVAARAEAMVEELDGLPYPKVKENMHELLRHFDMLHREALTRLFKEIIINHSDLHLKMQMDKSVKLLFSLYDLFHTEIQNGALAQEIMAGGDFDKYPRWIPVGNTNALKENTVYKYAEEGEDVLICKSEGEIHAVKNCCGNTSLPLDGASIARGYLICPWHGCNYRLSDGIMETNRLLSLKKYPINVSDTGEIRVGLNM